MREISSTPSYEGSYASQSLDPGCARFLLEDSDRPNLTSTWAKAANLRSSKASLSASVLYLCEGGGI